MLMMTIDKSRCVNCGACVTACSFRIFCKDESGEVQAKEKECMNCFHCAAACPTKAVCCDRLTEAELYPKFSIGGGIGISSPDLTPWESYTKSINFGPSVRWNLFSFGYWQRRVDAAKATLDATVADYCNTVLDAYRESESAWVTYHREIERTVPLLDAERFCREALSIAERRYDLGDIAIDDVITQQSLLLSAQENIVAHRAQLFDNAITLYRSLGGGWTDEAPPPAP